MARPLSNGAISWWYLYHYEVSHLFFGGLVMDNTTRGNRRSNRSSSRTSRNSRSQRNPRTGNRASRSSQGQSRRGTLTRPDTGYSLHSRRARYEPMRGGIISALLRPRVLLLLLIVVVVVIVLVVGVSSCIRRSHEASTQNIEESKPKNEQDARVAAGVSASMTSKFTEALDNGDLLATIAQNADQYEDTRLLDLALAEPSSRSFIAAYPSSDKSSRPYDGSVKRGEVPCLYNWDEHWGAVTYGDGPLAVTGSGPTTLAMAYMGLTGKTDFSPTEIAQQASKGNYANGDSGTKGEMFPKLTSSMGLTANEYDPNSSSASYSLGDNTVMAAELKEGTLTDFAHWVLVVNMNEDGSVTVFDPTSTYVSSRPWDFASIINASTKIYAISASDSTLAELEKNSTSSDKNENNGNNDGSSSVSSTSSENNNSSNDSSEDADSSSSSSSKKEESSTKKTDEQDTSDEVEDYSAYVY